MDENIINPYNWLYDWFINRADKLLKWRSNAWLDHGTGKVAVFCFHLM